MGDTGNMGDPKDDPAHCRRMADEFRVKAAQAPSVLMKMSYEALVREYEQRAARLLSRDFSSSTRH